MNTIEIKNLKIVKTISQWDEYDDKDTLSYELFIDGKEVIKGSYDLSTFFDDKHSNHILSGRCSYPSEGRDQSSRKYVNECFNGEHSWNYFNTCSCGHAGCASIWGGVKIKRRKHHIEYRVDKGDGYELEGILGSGKLFLKFPIEQVLTIRNELTKLALDYKPDEKPSKTIYKLFCDF